MKLRLLSVIVSFVTLIAACDQEAMRDKFTPHDEAEFAKAHLALYQARDFDAIIAQLNPQIVTDELQSDLEGIAEYFPNEQPNDIVLVGSNTISFADSWSANLTFQYEFTDVYLLIAVALLRENEQLYINGLNVQTIESSLEEMNQFHINGRGFPGYVFLSLAVIFPIFSLGTFVACLRTPIPKRKWMWALFVLVGFGTMSLNWTTGEFSYSILSWQLLGAGFVKPMYGPLILSIAAPLGAFVFWMRRKEWVTMQNKGET